MRYDQQLIDIYPRLRRGQLLSSKYWFRIDNNWGSYMGKIYGLAQNKDTDAH